MTSRPLDPIFSPTSIAVVGASRRRDSLGFSLLHNLVVNEFNGAIYPVNPEARAIHSLKCYPNVQAIPDPIDLAVVLVPRRLVQGVVEECIAKGVRGLVVISAGFSETGAEGAARETRIRQLLKDSGTRLVGPSSLGVVDLRQKTFLTANAAFDEPDLPVGRIFAASHSGGMIGTFLSRGKARGIHFAGLVSVGNEVNLSIGEICQATLDDPGIDGYVLFLETMRKAEALRAFALQAAMRGKPVLAYKLGRSAAARELAVSHTGALAGEDDIADVFLAECGIARVDTLEGLIEGFPLLARVPAQVRGARIPTPTARGP